jgi:GTP cyclohydrolase II
MGESRSIQGQLLHRGVRRLETVHGEFDVHVCQNLASGAYCLVAARGAIDSGEPLLARIHSSCVTSETFGGCDCDCVEQLSAALEAIDREGRGLVFYLMQEGRGAGFAAKVRDRMIVQASRHQTTTFEAYERLGLGRDHRRYEEVGQIVRLLGVRAPLRLLTNNPDKLAALVADAGLALDGAVPLASAASPWNLHYIAAKSRSGHDLVEPDSGARGADLPEEVAYFEPYVLKDAPRFVHLATYLLPIRDGDPCDGAAAAHWFHLHAYFDLHAGADRVVLTFGAPQSPGPLVRVQHESLLERLPLAQPAAKATWRRAVRRIVDHGAGCAAFVSPSGFDADLVERPGEDAAALALLEHHLKGRAGHPLVTSGEDGRLGDGLRSFGIQVLPPVDLGRAT